MEAGSLCSCSWLECQDWDLTREVELVEAEMASAEESQIGLDQVRTQSELVTQGRGYIDDLGQTEPGTQHVLSRCS